MLLFRSMSKDELIELLLMLLEMRLNWSLMMNVMWYKHIDALLRISGVSGEGSGVTVEGNAPVSDVAAPPAADSKTSAADDDDDDVDLFGEETEEEKKAAEERAAAAAAKPAKKKECEYFCCLDFCRNECVYLRNSQLITCKLAMQTLHITLVSSRIVGKVTSQIISLYICESFKVFN